jgi:hypothetical protein
MAATVVFALVSCHHAAPAMSVAQDLSRDVAAARARLAAILPPNMAISRAKLFDLKGKGEGILLHASPKTESQAHPSLALFLWPKSNSQDIVYETGGGSQTFYRIGTSERYRVYYSGPGFLEDVVKDAFCTVERR